MAPIKKDFSSLPPHRIIKTWYETSAQNFFLLRERL